MAELLIQTYRILSITKASEYQNLSETDKAWYNLFISAGIVDLQEESLVQEKLWDMFNEETNTGRELRDVNNGLTLPQVAEEP